MYSPKIREDLIPLLYQLKLCLDKPMTEILDDIVRPEVMEMYSLFCKEEHSFYSVNEEERR